MAVVLALIQPLTIKAFYVILFYVGSFPLMIALKIIHYLLCFVNREVGLRNTSTKHKNVYGMLIRR